MDKLFTSIGNACTDLIASVDDQFLIDRNIRKFFCTHLETIEDLSALRSDMPSIRSIPGGAGANVAHVISALGGTSHFISKVANDEEGTSFVRHMEANGVTCNFPPISSAELGSPQVATLITPDGERTFVSFDGVAHDFSDKDYDFPLIETSAVLYLDGYCFSSPYTPESFIKAAQANRKSGGTTFFNLGDLSILEKNPDQVAKLLQNCNGIICNYPEARILFGTDDPHEMNKRMAERFEVGAITHGADGAYVVSHHHVAHIPAASISDLSTIDTNGAGDHFSGGFIFGLMNDFSLEEAGKLGILCARDCLSHAGARPLGGHGSLKHLTLLAKT